MSKYLAFFITDFVRAKLGYNETTATLNFFGLCAIYSGIVLISAFALSYYMLLKYTCTGQFEILTINPFFFFVIIRAEYKEGCPISEMAINPGNNFNGKGKSFIC